ncbi:hypothetical protein QR680_019305 [Steinernema hermaphroditum]|uniref:F-box domain-containing protein n=1 Tax=Steinernema hermaphroditum TaxID=289476 RepID=A0AA39LAQ1_9BILA|nr:hypothetical protein QR680_019305 [Steinernema hermaphroditum]
MMKRQNSFPEALESSAKRPRESIPPLLLLPTKILLQLCNFMDLDSILSFERVSRRTNEICRKFFYRAGLSLRIVADTQYLTVRFKDSRGQRFIARNQLKGQGFYEQREVNCNFAHIRRYVVDSLNLYMVEVDDEILSTVLRLAQEHFRPKYLELSYRLTKRNQPNENNVIKLINVLFGKHLIHLKLRILPNETVFSRILLAITDHQLRKIELTQSSLDVFKAMFSNALAISGLFISMPLPKDRHIEAAEHAHTAIEKWKTSSQPAVYSFICISNNQPSSSLYYAFHKTLGIPLDDRKEADWQWNAPHYHDSDALIRVMHRQNAEGEAWAFVPYRNHMEHVKITFEPKRCSQPKVNLSSAWKTTDHPNHFEVELNVDDDSARFRIELLQDYHLFVYGSYRNRSPAPVEAVLTLDGRKSTGHIKFIDLRENRDNNEVFLVLKIYERSIENLLLEEDLTRLRTFSPQVFNITEDYDHLISSPRRFEYLKELFTYTVRIKWMP